jgi:hypothetical protein
MWSCARAVVLGAALTVAGCGIDLGNPRGLVGSGSPTAQTRSVAPFTKVSAGNGVHVELQQGSPAAVVVEAQPNLLDAITTTVKNGELSIGSTTSYTTRVGVVVRVTSPGITGVSTEGGVQLDGTGLAGTDLSLGAAGGSRVRLSGTAARLDAHASGGAVLELGSFAVGDATIDLSGGVRATLKVSGVLRGTASGGVVVDLAVKPASVQVDTSGGSVVTYP